jgi:hypothetical protein
VRDDGRVLYRAVVPAARVREAVARLLDEHPIDHLVLGDRTAAREVERALGDHLRGRAELVDEHRSTEEGRRRYFRDNPPRGWRRLLPLGLQTPPTHYDDYVAVVLAERFLAARRG